VTDGNEARGRTEFAAIIVLGAIVFLGIGLAAWLRSGEINALGTFARPIVLLALGLLAYGGRSWARTAATIWMGLIAIVFSLSAVPIIGDHLGAGVFIIATGLLFGLAAFRLQTSESIDAFLRRSSGGKSVDRAS
jgi:hypothetical protein